MAEPDEKTETREPDSPWGTWEELLLACAVHRYGTESWDSVAVEIQKRSSNASDLLTPNHCQQKYLDLKRRYQNVAVSATTDDDNKPEAAVSVPWLDDLRKLRVTELKRELERYDVSIVSLQLKVKRLKEEREQSLKEDENGEDAGDKSDLEKSVEKEKEDEEKRGEPEKSPESVTRKTVSGDESDRENQSVNESNSTDPIVEDHKTGLESNYCREPETVRTGEGEPDQTGGSTKPVGEDSCNGSSDSIEREEDRVRDSVKTEEEEERGVNDSPELLESVAESKGGGGGDERTAKTSSDVQSSASKSKKEGGGGSDKVQSRSISGDEPEIEDQSPAIKRISVKSQPLVDLVQIVQSHKLGSLFERRLKSQETPEYMNLIRQHIDLETIRIRLEEGWYSNCNSKFFRDLLLLFNNAIIFFGKKSRESTAAIELREVISKEIVQRNLKEDLSAEERSSVPSRHLPSKPEPQPSDSLVLKPNISGPMIVCRKRSSIAAKASGLSSGADRKREQKAALLEEKPILDWKQPNKFSDNARGETNSSDNDEEGRITKKRTRDTFASGSRSSKKNGIVKNRTSAAPNKNPEPISNPNQGKGASSSENLEPKSDKNANTMAGAKKKSAANFLNRMKRSSSTNNNGPLLETLKSSAISSNNSNNRGGAEQKRSGNGKGEAKKELASRRGSGGRQVKEKESPTKRSVGRPPKRAAAPPAGVSGKRGREGGDTDAVASRQPKKRSRK